MVLERKVADGFTRPSCTRNTGSGIVNVMLEKSPGAGGQERQLFRQIDSQLASDLVAGCQAFVKPPATAMEKRRTFPRTERPSRVSR